MLPLALSGEVELGGQCAQVFPRLGQFDGAFGHTPLQFGGGSLKIFFHALPFRDVVIDPDHAHDLPLLIGDGRALAGQPAYRAVGRENAELGREHPGLEPEAGGLLNACHIVRVDGAVEVRGLADGAIGRPAEELVLALIPRRLAGYKIQVPGAHPAGGHCESKPFLA